MGKHEPLRVITVSAAPAAFNALCALRPTRTDESGIPIAIIDGCHVSIIAADVRPIRPPP